MTPGRADLARGGFVVLAAIAFQSLWLGLPAAMLGIAVVIAFGLWVGSPWRPNPSVRPVFLLGIIVFLIHVTEEYLTGLHREGPALFDRVPWSDARYLSFNGAWAMVFVAAALSWRPDRRLPALIVLFFAVAAGVGNGVIHVLLAINRGGYFPGLWTAPLCFVVGAWLLVRLYTR